MVLNMMGENADSKGCVQEQVDWLTHAPVESVIQLEVIPYSPYCSRFTISNHPLAKYNGEYVQQPSPRNSRPWFANGELARLYWFDGCDSGQPGWSLDDRPFMSGGCRDGRGRSANVYYQLHQHTAPTCKRQCNADPMCVAYHYVPPPVDLGP